MPSGGTPSQEQSGEGRTYSRLLRRPITCKKRGEQVQWASVVTIFAARRPPGASAPATASAASCRLGQRSCSVNTAGRPARACTTLLRTPQPPTAWRSQGGVGGVGGCRRGQLARPHVRLGIAVRASQPLELPARHAGLQPASRPPHRRSVPAPAPPPVRAGCPRPRPNPIATPPRTPSTGSPRRT